MANLTVQKENLHVPALDEVAKILQDGVSKNFASVSVNVVDCPDLTQDPFYLSSAGLCGNPRLADIGGPPYLIPLVQREKIYSFPTIAELVELPNAFMIGAGAGPAHLLGVNTELINNIKLSEPPVNNAHTAKVSTKDGGCILEMLSSHEFCLMGNFLCSDGLPGKVLEVKASQRTGEESFMSCLRKTLNSHYGNKPVGLGGVFLLEKGKAKIHIMPDFSKTPLNSEEDVHNWLKFYEMDSTLICLGELVSHDPGLDLRVEHFHCFSRHGQGGHYHYDTTPDDAQYRGYFVLPEYIYRIDCPKETTSLGR
ncbi:hypothetical protein ACJMK2_012310 [Sinanodonta woodiana]|uniref:DUF1907 domain-containing protein n=1 Tax=Sinanodonta woodiana TaxID=1069815 RepID=A0ABD3VAQ3_SINWO